MQDRPIYKGNIMAKKPKVDMEKPTAKAPMQPVDPTCVTPPCPPMNQDPAQMIEDGCGGKKPKKKP
jgi:hypothetical protein